MKKTIGILHPGEMGVSVAAAAAEAGHAVFWASEGRSTATRARAAEHALQDCGSLADLCRKVDIILSICPPAAAEEIARLTADTGFKGMYIDANAISPDAARRIASRLAEAGIDFVDGGIIGGPAWQPGTTWLHLSGTGADEAAALFTGGPLETQVIGREIGSASALKMCYAAYTKGSTALLAAVLAAAEGHGVRDHLEAQWGAQAEQNGNRVRRVTRKAWRFEGELAEIAATFEAVGVPGGFHRAGAEIYRRLAGFKADAEPAPLEAVLRAIRQGEKPDQSSRGGSAA